METNTRQERLAEVIKINTTLLVMWRDASFWKSPGTARRYHIPSEKRGPFGHPVAECNSRIQLDPESVTTIDKVKILMCHKCKWKLL